MPRFRWANVDDAVVAQLGAHMRTKGDPLVALSRRYGTPPGPALVADHWTVLRDTWLANAPQDA